MLDRGYQQSSAKARHAGSLRVLIEHNACDQQRPIASFSFPPFEPHPWLKGAPCPDDRGPILGRRPNAAQTRHAIEVELPDGDRLLVLETVPPGWESPRPTAVLVHGLAGSADASYVVRVGQRLVGWAFVWCGSTYVELVRALGLPAVSITPDGATMYARCRPNASRTGRSKRSGQS